jgi:cobalt/nickel transport system permease protein
MLWAVHISDGVLMPGWLLAGFAGAGLLCWFGAWRLRESEIPRIALLTAVFFVVTTIHIKVAGSSVHLLGNALVGVLLGSRASLAIAVGLLLQAVMLGHGGIQPLGVNCCVIALPALGAWFAFHALHRLRWATHPTGRSLLVFAAVIVGTLSLIYSCTLLATNLLATVPTMDLAAAKEWTLHPLTLTAVLIVSAVLTWLERRMENAPEFPLGLLIGETTVLATIGLNFLVLAFGGESPGAAAPLINFVVHLPLALIEGVVLGVTLGFLMRVKPDMLLGKSP